MSYFLKGKFSPPLNAGLDTTEFDAYGYIVEDMILSASGESIVPVAIYSGEEKQNFVLRTVTTVPGEITDESTDDHKNAIHKLALESVIEASAKNMEVMSEI
ncbi:hypothetical protein [Pectobacterium betavasculorum]|uniref:Uncharacterized protein n=1 Tax=Pectobacterium betavasculorum TaxID=55207 RepID=A0ABR4V275_9GAMM|nr:hypothetical protein [Pectobacterium betavasculorum]KFX20812.1 hypothetical protein JV35_06320 [Pectobacterium betavasculorum]